MCTQIPDAVEEHRRWPTHAARLRIRGVRAARDREAAWAVLTTIGGARMPLSCEATYEARASSVMEHVISAKT
jgi:hypothetical protein